MEQKTKEMYVRLSDIREAFKDNDEALQIVNGLERFFSNEIPHVSKVAELDSIKEVIEYLNSVLGTHYKDSTEKNKSLIRARLREGFTVEDFKVVIDKKASAWLTDPQMQKYLRPETLFGTKFESYLNEPNTYKLKGNIVNRRDESTFDRIKRLAEEGAFGE